MFTPANDGIYRLVATSFKPGTTGGYTLRVREVAEIGKPQIVTGELTKTDRADRGRFMKLHKVELTAGQPCVLELESSAFDTYLALTDATAKAAIAANDDVAPGNTQVSRIDFTPEQTGTFTVIVTSANAGETGPYTLRIRQYGAMKSMP